MQFLDGALSKNNPLIRGLYTQNFDQGQDFPPPVSEFRITDDGDNRVTDSGDKRITD